MREEADLASVQFSNEGNLEVLSLSDGEEIDLIASVVVQGPFSGLSASSPNEDAMNPIELAQIDSPVIVGF